MYEHTHDNKSLPYPDNLIKEIGVPEVTVRARKQYRKIIDSNILTERETDIIESYYDKNLTLNDIGKKYSVTRERIRQLINLAVKKLARCKPFIAADKYDKYFEFTFSRNPRAHMTVITIAHSKTAAEYDLKHNKIISEWCDLCVHTEARKITEKDYLEQLRDRIRYQKLY